MAAISSFLLVSLVYSQELSLLTDEYGESTNQPNTLQNNNANAEEFKKEISEIKQETDRSNLLNILNELDTVSNETINTIIILKTQTLSKVADEIREKNKPALENYLSRLRQLESKFKKIPENEALSMPLEKLIEAEMSTLTDEEKEQLKEINREIDNIDDNTNKEIYAKQSEILKISQDEAKIAVDSCGGIVTGNSVLINSIFARIPFSCLDELKQNPEILAVYKDEPRPANLDKSSCAIGAPAWHSAGYTGGVWDLAIVDTGIDGTHPALNVDFAAVFHTTAVSDPNYDDNLGSTDDFHGHGTPVSYTHLTLPTTPYV